MLVLPLFLLLLSTIAIAEGGHQNQQEICSFLVNNSICTNKSSTTASWCDHRNPYLIPRFLIQKDAATLEKLSKLASPVCEKDPTTQLDICYMFSRFFATTRNGRPLFVANVVTNDTDTNSLIALDGLTYEKIPGLAPGTRYGSRFGDLMYTDTLANANIDYLGASITVNPQKYFAINHWSGQASGDDNGIRWYPTVMDRAGVALDNLGRRADENTHGNHRTFFDDNAFDDF